MSKTLLVLYSCSQTVSKGRDGRQQECHVQVIKTPNAETPLASGAGTPLLTMDVWEHAYYLDVQNRRPDYIKTFLGELVNWDFVEQNYASAK